MFVTAGLASMRRWLLRRSPPRFFFCCCMDSWAPWGDGRFSWGQRADLRHQPDGVPLRSSLRLQKKARHTESMHLRVRIRPSLFSCARHGAWILPLTCAVPVRTVEVVMSGSQSGKFPSCLLQSLCWKAL